MSKNLVDKDKAYEIYFMLGTSRSLSKLHKQLSPKYPQSTPSYPTLKNWAKKGKWKESCAVRDMEVVEKVRDSMMPKWVAVKTTLVQTFIDQLNAAIDDGIMPENSRDLVAISKELRALLGVADRHEIINTVTREVTDDPDILKSANALAKQLSEHA